MLQRMTKDGNGKKRYDRYGVWASLRSSPDYQFSATLFGGAH